MITVIVEGEHLILDVNEAAGDDHKIRLDLKDAWHLLQNLTKAYSKADANRSKRIIREQYKHDVEDEYVAPGEDVGDQG